MLLFISITQKTIEFMARKDLKLTLRNEVLVLAHYVTIQKKRQKMNATVSATGKTGKSALPL